MNPTILPPSMGKIENQTVLFNFGTGTSVERKLWIRAC